MPTQNLNRVKKMFRKKKYKKSEVLKIISLIMDKQDPSTSAGTNETRNDYHNDFFNTGRIGRRNALPDILSYEPCNTSTADLPARLSTLTTNDKLPVNSTNPNEPSTSHQSCTTSNSRIDANSMKTT